MGWFNRTIMEMTCAMLLSADVSSAFWAEALSFVVFVNNCASTKANQSKSPYELWIGSKLRLKYLHPFGCPVYLLKPLHQWSKLSPKSSEGIYLGPAGDTSFHRIWVKASRIVTTSCDVIFIKPAAAQLQLHDAPVATASSEPMQVNQDLNETHLLGLDDTFPDGTRLSPIPLLPSTVQLAPLSPIHLGFPVLENVTPEVSPIASPVLSPLRSPLLSPLCLADCLILRLPSCCWCHVH